MDQELDRLLKEKEKARRELAAAERRYDQAEQAWLRCLERRLLGWKPASESTK